MASSELLKQIQAGKRLKRAETNDRSAPQVVTPKGSGGSTGAGGSFPSAPLTSGGGSGGGPPQLGDLFAGGMPKLKPASQSKLGALGKPPSIPKSDGPLAPTPPVRNVPTPPAPVPGRPVPPRRNDIGSSAPLPPRRAPPPIRSDSPPAAPPRPRTQSPASPASRPIPAVPIRNPVTSPTKPKVATPDRAPPPLPRSSPVVAPSSVRTVPAPPARKPPPAIPTHIESAARTYPPEATVSDPPGTPPRAKSPLRTPHLPPPSRRLPLAASNGDRSLAPRSKIPSPPPNAGAHTFPVTGFPPPRDFKNTTKSYKSGNRRGSNFDLGNL